MAKYPITNFARGEFGPELYGRVDLPQYGAGAKELTNAIVQRYGGVAARPGFRYVRELDPAIGYSLIPFSYSIELSYVLVMGDSEMQLAAGGGMVTEEHLKIVSMTKEAQAILEVPYHDMDVGDEIFLDENTGPVELQNRMATVVAVIDADHIRIDVDTTNAADLTASEGITRVAAPTPPAAPEAPQAEPDFGTEDPEIVAPGDNSNIPYWKNGYDNF